LTKNFESTLLIPTSEMLRSTVIAPGQNEKTALAHLFDLLGNGDLMRLRRVCRGLRALVDMFMAEKLNIETSLAAYLGTISLVVSFSPWCCSSSPQHMPIGYLLGSPPSSEPCKYFTPYGLRILFSSLGAHPGSSTAISRNF
jgi:F-box domain